jgi:glycyl-tRNA synthetase
MPLKETLRRCFEQFPPELTKEKESLIEEIQTFIMNRIKTVFLDYGFSKDEIDASLEGHFTGVYETYCKVKSLHELRQANNTFPLLYEVYKRAKGQLAQAKTPADYQFSDLILKNEADIQLNHVLNHVEKRFNETIQNHDYNKSYELISEIQPALSYLFEKVKILDEDVNLQNNRIAMLRRVFALFDQLLDFSKISEK